SVFHLCEIRSVGTFEEPAFGPGASFTVIFNCEQPVFRNRPVAILVFGTAIPTKNMVPLGCELRRVFVAATWTRRRMLAIVSLVEISAVSAHDHVLRMPHVFGEEVIRKQIHGFTAGLAWLCLYPNEILHARVFIAAAHTTSPIKLAHLALQSRADPSSFPQIFVHIERAQFLSNHPPRHRIN